jgi:hypothetical protein
MVAVRRLRSRDPNGVAYRETRPGIAVDARGGEVVDPTENVRQLVLAESKYQDAMRGELEKQMTMSVAFSRDTMKILSDNVVAFQNAQRDAETKRIDQLASTRQEFQNTIRDMLAESVRTTSNLVSTQLVQIQATFDTRVTKLEAGAFTQAGKSSVQDPATADALTRMGNSISSFATMTAEMMNKSRLETAEAISKLNTTIVSMQTSEGRSGGNIMGRDQSNTRMWAVIMAVAAVASPVISILVAVLVTRGH